MPFKLPTAYLLLTFYLAPPGRFPRPDDGSSAASRRVGRKAICQPCCPAPCWSLDLQNEAFGSRGKARPHRFSCHPQARRRPPSLALESKWPDSGREMQSCAASPRVKDRPAKVADMDWGAAGGFDLRQAKSRNCRLSVRTVPTRPLYRRRSPTQGVLSYVSSSGAPVVRLPRQPPPLHGVVFFI